MIPITDSISFKYMISSRNIYDEIYDIDIKRFFGFYLTPNKREEIKCYLMSLKKDVGDE